MIEVNLLPGGRRGSRKGSGFSLSSLSLPSFSSGSMDLWVLGTAAGVILGVGAMGYLFMTAGSRYDELTVSVQEAVSDSSQFADIIQRTQRLQAQRDSIAERVAVIQEIDKDRYLWAHVMDEVARALPEYTWLTSILQVGVLDNPQLNIRGRTGNNRALTTFMDNLEASHFIQRVSLIASTQGVLSDSEGNGRLVYDFELEVEYVDPPLDMIETVPLFRDVGPIADPEVPGTGSATDSVPDEGAQGGVN